MEQLHRHISATWSGNPIITHMRTADPSPGVWNGRIWLYCSHDQDDAEGYGTMDGYHVFSSSDLVHWHDHGEVLHSRDVAWGIKEGGWMWAPDCAFRDGIYYFYFPHFDRDRQWRVGVATSSSPTGPFTDIGHWIEGTDGIDPCCFVDDDGSAYLHWGARKMARLKDNMIELAEEPRTLDCGTKLLRSVEGMYMHKRSGIYYYSWSDWQDEEYQGFYSMGPSPYGPFEYLSLIHI